jgi:hypothetical protein
MKKGIEICLLSAQKNSGRFCFNEDINEIISNSTISKLDRKSRDVIRIIKFHPRRNSYKN